MISRRPTSMRDGANRRVPPFAGRDGGAMTQSRRPNHRRRTTVLSCAQARTRVPSFAGHDGGANDDERRPTITDDTRRSCRSRKRLPATASQDGASDGTRRSGSRARAPPSACVRASARVRASAHACGRLPAITLHGVSLYYFTRCYLTLLCTRWCKGDPDDANWGARGRQRRGP